MSPRMRWRTTSAGKNTHGTDADGQHRKSGDHQDRGGNPGDVPVGVGGWGSSPAWCPTSVGLEKICGTYSFIGRARRVGVPPFGPPTRSLYSGLPLILKAYLVWENLTGPSKPHKTHPDASSYSWCTLPGIRDETRRRRTRVERA